MKLKWYALDEIDNRLCDYKSMSCNNLPNGVLFKQLEIRMANGDESADSVSTALQFVPDINWNPDKEAFEVIAPAINLGEKK